MESPVATKLSQHPDSEFRGMLLENESRRLLVHLDSQEAGMKAVQALLRDLAAESLSGVDRRRLRSRLTAAIELTRRLADDRARIVREMAKQLSANPDDVNFSRLINVVSAGIRQPLIASRRRVLRMATELSRQVATVRMILGEERRINAVAYQLATGMVGSDRYDATGDRSIQPADIHFEIRS